MSAPWIWIDTDAELRRAIERLSDRPALAIDTEADSFYHYFHKCCLIQISDGEDVYLIDSLALSGLEPLGLLMARRNCLKVLHAAEQDVMYLRRDYGFHLTPIFGTMIAGQLLGQPQIGLAGLLHSHLGLKLDKGCQRDDWSRRPLSDRQMAYAAEDVRHLIVLAGRLRDALLEAGRLEWAEEEFDLVSHRAWDLKEFDPDDVWGVKGARDLTPRQAAVLRELFVMRDRRARDADVPPFRILSDEALLVLARRSPTGVSDMGGIKGVTPLVRRRLGTDILEAVRRGLEGPEASRPETPRRTPARRRNAASLARLQRLREWRKLRARELGLDPGVLFPQSTLEALSIQGLPGLDAPQEVPGLRRWRRSLILPEAARLLS